MNYIIAVSGGVDSVVLLDMLVNREIEVEADAQYIVAHFDHGIREESGSDAEFVRALAQRYGLGFELGSAKLGKGASEDTARTMRYNFLQQCRKKHNAPSIVLAHHQDDMVETAIINLIRGTSWRGLSSLESTDELFRPLLNKTKEQLTAYAQHHHLDWVEDSTNTDQTYLRNYVRHTLIPLATEKDSTFGEKMVALIEDNRKTRPGIDSETAELVGRAQLSGDSYKFSRYSMIMWPQKVSSEVVYRTLTDLDSDWHPTSQHVRRALHFAKTAKPDKKMTVNKKLHVISHEHHVEFKKY